MELRALWCNIVQTLQVRFVVDLLYKFLSITVFLHSKSTTH